MTEQPEPGSGTPASAPDKFLRQEEMAAAYRRLEAAFTRKCQQLARLRQERGQPEGSPAEPLPPVAPAGRPSAPCRPAAKTLEEAGRYACELFKST